jgi:hypothetical protein
VLLVEFISGVIDENAKFGISTVKPNRAIKKCKIRNLLVEYFLTDYAIFLVTPKSCCACERVIDCEEDFVFQIIEKFNSKHEDSDQYFVF